MDLLKTFLKFSPTSGRSPVVAFRSAGWSGRLMA